MENINNTLKGSELKYAKWLDTLVSEKGIDTEELLEIEGNSGTNLMPLSVVLNTIKGANIVEREGIMSMLVKIDFKGGDILDYFKHLAKALAV